MTLGGSIVLNQDNGQKIMTRPLKSLAPKGITHQKLLKLMKNVLPKELSMEGISNQSSPPLHAMLYVRLKIN